MCTVTAVWDDTGAVRLACNRDERHSRPSALPPRTVAADGRLGLMPIDPVSGGTWVAVNDTGLMLALLNCNPRPAAPETPKQHSRGTVIPQLLGCAGLAAAVERACRIDPEEFGPFRLVLVDGSGAAELRSDGTALHLAPRQARGRPLLWTSSSLGDALVETPRRRLFEMMFAAATDSFATQDAYHEHFWPEDGHLSVCMSRADARTVSHTTITVRGETATMSYLPLGPCRADGARTSQLTLTLEARR